jgi:hypothetical protein
VDDIEASPFLGKKREIVCVSRANFRALGDSKALRKPLPRFNLSGFALYANHHAGCANTRSYFIRENSESAADVEHAVAGARSHAGK